MTDTKTTNLTDNKTDAYEERDLLNGWFAVKDVNDDFFSDLLEQLTEYWIREIRKVLVEKQEDSTHVYIKYTCDTDYYRREDYDLYVYLFYPTDLSTNWRIKTIRIMHVIHDKFRIKEMPTLLSSEAEILKKHNVYSKGFPDIPKN